MLPTRRSDQPGFLPPHTRSGPDRQDLIRWRALGSNAASMSIALLALLLAAFAAGTFGVVTAFGGSREVALAAAVGGALLLQAGRWSWDHHRAGRRAAHARAAEVRPPAPAPLRSAAAEDDRRLIRPLVAISRRPSAGSCSAPSPPEWSSACAGRGSGAR